MICSQPAAFVYTSLRLICQRGISNSVFVDVESARSNWMRFIPMVWWATMLCRCCLLVKAHSRHRHRRHHCQRRTPVGYQAAGDNPCAPFRSSRQPMCTLPRRYRPHVLEDSLMAGVLYLSPVDGRFVPGKGWYFVTHPHQSSRRSCRHSW